MGAALLWPFFRCARGDEVEVVKPDSPLWTTPAADGPGPFAHLEIPDNLGEIAAQVVRDSAEELKRRLTPYSQPRMPPLWRMLR